MDLDSIPVSVLAVDDIPENLLKLEAMLGMPGRSVLTADTGEAALELAEIHDFAVVLLDVKLPGISGFEVAERLRAQPRTRGVPIIFVTAVKQQPVHVFRGYDTGAVDYLFQPVDPHVVRSKVAVFCELWAQRRLIEEKNLELERHIAEIETLRGLIPICASCKKIRDDQGFWQRCEEYIAQRTGVLFTHGICDDCYTALYGELDDG